MKKLFVVSGGVGSEREVSLASGKNVIETLTREGLACESVVVEKDRSFVYRGKVMSEEEGIRFLKEENALVFQVIHGTYGEDGELTEKLEDEGVAYIGSPSSALKITIDKYATETVLKEHGVHVVDSLCVRTLDEIPKKDEIQFPCVVKPSNEGSSVGVTKVYDYETLRKVLQESVTKYDAILVQKCLSGREFTCGAVEIQGGPRALVPTEVILTQGDLFDFTAKYSPGGCLEVTPAEVDGTTMKKIQALAVRVHTVCGCKGISRTDMMMDDTGELVVLEINTVPGMTKTSFIPAEMKASGYTLSEFIKSEMGARSNL